MSTETDTPSVSKKYFFLIDADWPKGAKGDEEEEPEDIFAS